MTALYAATKQALAFTMRDFSTVRDFEAARAVLQDTIRSALVEEEKAAAWLAERKEHWRKEREKAQTTKDQDPELSAALGWPGGISDPVLDRVQLLRMVAALMQDKLWEDHRVKHLWDHAQEQAKTCAWRDNLDAIYETECGNLHIINDGTPEDNGMKYCCYCGKEIKDESPT